MKACYDFLGPSVDLLKYSKKQEDCDVERGAENKRLCQRFLLPLDEFFMTLVRLRLGLLEQDLGYRFGVSQSKNDNTFKGLVGISPDGVITFVSSLFPGSISDRSLTRLSGVLDLLEAGDSVMADRVFDIEEDVLLRGVRLNIPLLHGKTQLCEKELIITRRIASLRIHVERAMERIKNFHIFDKSIPASLTEIADRIFLVCCVLTNFQQPLV